MSTKKDEEREDPEYAASYTPYKVKRIKAFLCKKL